MSDDALVLEGVRKTYGRRVALDGLSFEAPRGAITGLVGRNGAGKTTCFSIVGGLLQSDAGRVDVLGKGPFDVTAHKGLLGLLPQDSELPGHARVHGVLSYLARLQGLERGRARREVDRVLDALALSDRAHSRVRELSHGMRRRVAVAQALLGDPQLVLLDEPTSGLDPQLVASVREVLRAQRERGTSLIVSSHVLSDLEAICDHVVFIEAGRCTRRGALAELTGRKRLVRFTLGRAPELGALEAKLPDLELRYAGAVLQVEAKPGGDVAALNRRVLQALLELGADVLEIRLGHSLEQAYLTEHELT